MVNSTSLGLIKSRRLSLETFKTINLTTRNKGTLRVFDRMPA